MRPLNGEASEKLVVTAPPRPVNRPLHPSPFQGIPTIEPTILSPTGADLDKLDGDAVRATQRLISRGFEAYLVGGCVRDLLLGRMPKDYDIATAARPPQVKRTFPRNCRIIGRRFKLAHLHFHDNTKILEVSTFRRTPQMENPEEDLLITRDNEFGTAEEDALRRDFTVNALFLDPTRDTILDYTHGLEDLHARVIRTIGDPRVRFREDPVRILRAAKFAGRLGFTIEPGTFAAMAEASGDLVRAAPPRLLEEILRLLRGGHALDSFQLLRDVGALRSLVPVLADFLQAARHDQRVEFWRLLDALDQRVQDGHVLNNGVLLGALLVCPVMARAETDPRRSPSSVAEDLLGPLSYSLRLPRRDAGCLKRICGVQHRFSQTDESKRFRVAGFVQSPYFEEALDLFELRMLALQTGEGALDHWRQLAERGHRDAPAEFHHEHPPVHEGPEGDDGQQDAEPAADNITTDEVGDVDDAPSWPASPEAANADGPGEPRRRRRRRRGRRRGRRDEGAPAQQTQPAIEPPQQLGFDFAHPEGIEATAPYAATDDVPDDVTDDIADEETGQDIGVEVDGAAPHVAAQHSGARDADVGQASADGLPPQGPGRRRRRRRRRGRHRGEGDRFPPSDLPTPHGEGTDREAPLHEPLVDAEPAPDDRAAFAGQGEHGDSAVDRGVDSADAPPGAATQQHQERGGRRRRRRGRRGGGGRPDEHREGGHGGGGHGPRPPARDERRDSGPRPPGREERRDGPRPPVTRQPGREDRRDSHRRGHGSPRDVDVVPRHRDRRGKIHVIEPAPLDLSAFDVELDPKRVPTFGSIVEGKGRPKKRSPRVRDDGVDDYRPPPPPGGDVGPAAPPPPPADAPDTFGDW